MTAMEAEDSVVDTEVEDMEAEVVDEVVVDMEEEEEEAEVEAMVRGGDGAFPKEESHHVAFGCWN